MITMYRIYDHTSRNTLANGIPSLEQAQEVLHFLKLSDPANEIEIEEYKTSQVKSGFGRDPDLH